MLLLHIILGVIISRDPLLQKANFLLQTIGSQVVMEQLKQL